MKAGEAVSQLVRVITLPDPMLPIYTHHPHEGMIICLDHLRQLDCDPTVEEIPENQVSFWGHRCLMCAVHVAPGRLCANEGCNTPLHPQWPAVYCCNRCALDGCNRCALDDVC